MEDIFLRSKPTDFSAHSIKLNANSFFMNSNQFKMRQKTKNIPVIKTGIDMRADLFIITSLYMIRKLSDLLV